MAACERVALDVARRVQSFDKASVEKFMAMKGHEMLIGAMNNTSVNDLLAESASALGYIAFNHEKYTPMISTAGGVKALIRLCSPKFDHAVVSSAAGTLFLLSFDPDMKKDFASSGGVEALVELLKTATDLKVLTWTVGILAALTFENSEVALRVAAGGNNDILAAVLQLCAAQENENCLTYAVGLVHNLSAAQDHSLQQRLVQAGAVPRMMDLCHPTYGSAVIALAMRTLRSFAADRACHGAMVDAKIVPRLVRFCLSSGQKEVLTEAVLALAALAADEDVLKGMGRQGMLQAYRRVAALLGADAPQWLLDLKAQLETTLAVWRGRSARMLLMGNPGSRAASFASGVGGRGDSPKFGLQSEHAAFQMLRVAQFFDIARLHKGESRSLAVDVTLNFEREAVADDINPTRFGYQPPRPRESAPTAAQALAKLREFLTAVACDSDTDVGLIFFSGHGSKGGGGLTLPGGALEPGTVFDMWAKCRSKRPTGSQGPAGGGAGRFTLVLVLDSCHSGAWVRMARERKLEDVVVQSACAEDEGSLQGAFLQAWLAAQRHECRPEEAVANLHHAGMHPEVYLPWEAWAPGQEPLVSSAKIELLQSAGIPSDSTQSGDRPVPVGLRVRDMSPLHGLMPRAGRRGPSRGAAERLCGSWRLQTTTNQRRFCEFARTPKSVAARLLSGILTKRAWILAQQFELVSTFDASSEAPLPMEFTTVLAIGKGYATSTFEGRACTVRGSWDGDSMMLHYRLIQTGMQVWLRLTVAEDGHTLIEQQSAADADGGSCTNDAVYRKILSQNGSGGDNVEY
jgi:hypothetical protein